MNKKRFYNELLGSIIITALFGYRFLEVYPAWANTLKLNFNIVTFVILLCIAPIALFFWYTNKINQKNKDKKEIEAVRQTTYQAAYISFFIFAIISTFLLNSAISYLYLFVYTGTYMGCLIYRYIKNS